MFKQLISRFCRFVILAVLVILIAGQVGHSNAQDIIAAPNSADPAIVSPELQQSFQRSLDKYQAIHGEGRSYSIVQVESFGGYAYAVAQEMINGETGQLGYASVTLLASQNVRGSWRVMVPRLNSASHYNALLQRIPNELLDAPSKAYYTYIDYSHPQFRSLRNQTGHFLPWPAGQDGYVTAKDDSYGSPSHIGQIDFDLRGIGFSGDVVASKPGTVVYVKEISNKGGCDPSLWKWANMVVIRHDSGEYSWYVHLAKDSVPVVKGSRVEYGTKIGVEGATGYSCGVHLHYMASTDKEGSFDVVAENDAPWAKGITRVDFTESSWSALQIRKEPYISRNSAGSAYDCPISNDQVAIYDDVNYGTGKPCRVLGIGNHGTLGDLDNKTSSVKVGSNVKLTLYSNTGLSGESEQFTSSDPDLSNNETIQKDEASSAKVESKGSQPPPPGGNCQINDDQAALFDDVYFNPDKPCVVLNRADVASLGELDNKISSVRVGKNVKLVLYENTSFGGSSETFYNDDHNLDDNSNIQKNEASSAKLQSRDTGEGTQCKENQTPGEYEAILFDNPRYGGGACAILRVGEYPNLDQLKFENLASSIRVGSKVSIRICAKNNFDESRGPCDTFDGDVSDLDKNGDVGREDTSSAIVKVKLPCNPLPDGVVLYESSDYKGGCTTFTAGRYNLRDYGYDNMVSSLRFVGAYSSGWKMTVCGEANMAGSCSTFTGNDNTLSGDAVGNDRASSLEIVPLAPTTALALQDIANPESDGDYEVRWNALPNATGYNLHEQFNAGAWIEAYSGENLNAGMYGRVPGTWCYQVRAVNSAGAGPFSAAKCTTVVPPPMPDLKINSVSPSNSTPTVGQAVTVNVAVQNVGQAAAGASTCTLYQGNPSSGGTAIGSKDCGALAANASSTVSFTWTPAATGQVTLVAVADSGNALDESSEANNQGSATVTVQSVPTTTSLRVTPANQTVPTGSNFCIQIEVQQVTNLGSFEFLLGFPVDILEAKSVTVGPFLGSTGRQVIPLTPTINNATGEAGIGAASLGSAAGPNGNGALAEVCFSPKKAGTAALTLKSGTITDAAVNSQVIPAALVNGTVTISSCYWADLNCDGKVNIVDVQLVAGRWGTKQGDPGYDPKYDLDSNGRIDIVDVQRVAAQWGWPSRAAQKPSQPTATMTLSIDPATLNMQVGETRTISFKATNASNLAGFDTKISYNPALLKVNSVTLTNFLSSTGRQVFPLGPNIDNASGSVTFGAFSLGTAPGVNGTGALVNIEVTTLSAGTGALNVQDTSATDPDANIIPVTEVDGTVNVSAPVTCYRLTRSHTGQGSDPVATPANSEGCNAGRYTAGAAISLSAGAASGWRVKSWSGTSNNSSTASTNSVVMPANDHAVSVTYEVIPSTAPTITSFSPTGGPVGTKVTINGTNFIGVDGVTFNNITAQYSVISSTKIEATVPSNATSGLIRVNTASESAPSTSSFTVYQSCREPAANEIALYEHANYNASQNGACMVLGIGDIANLDSLSGKVTSLKFGSANVALVLYRSADFAGEADVHYSSTPKLAAYQDNTARSARVRAITTCSQGPDVVILYDRDKLLGLCRTLSVGDHASLDALDNVATSLFVGANVLVDLYPDASSGGTPTRYSDSSNNLGTYKNIASSARVQFRPAITSFSPPSGPVGTTVTIYGRNLSNATEVRFNNTPTTPTNVSSTQVVAVVPSGATSGKITVVTPNGSPQSTTDYSVTAAGSWISANIGAASGTSQDSGNLLTISGTGGDLWSTSDNVYYAYKSANGSQTFVAKITSWNANGVANSKAGIMMRASTAQSSPHYSIHLTGPKGALKLKYRTALGSSTVSVNGPKTSTLPLWLRLEKNDNAVAASYSTNGANWISLGKSIAITGMESSHLFGMMIAPSSTAKSVSATFEIPDANAPSITSFSPTSGAIGTSVTINGINLSGTKDVSFNGVKTTPTSVSPTQVTAVVPQGAASGRITLTTSSGTATSPGVFTVLTQVAWMTANIGLASGSLTQNGGQYVLSATGGDLWGGSDNVYYAYQAANGDQTFTTRLTSWSPAGLKVAKAGMMIRASLDPAAPHFSIHVTGPNRDLKLKYRTSSGGSTLSINGPAKPALPLWLRLVKSGSTVSAYHSKDGSTWSLIGTPVTIPGIETSHLYGLVLAPKSETVRASATFEVLGRQSVRVRSFHPRAALPGSKVIIRGSGLGDTQQVLFGGVPAEFVVLPDFSIEAFVPTDAVTGRITVITPEGEYTSRTSFVLR